MENIVGEGDIFQLIIMLYKFFRCKVVRMCKPDMLFFNSTAFKILKQKTIDMSKHEWKRLWAKETFFLISICYISRPL